MCKLVNYLEDLIDTTNYEIYLGGSSEYDQGYLDAKQELVDKLTKIVKDHNSSIDYTKLIAGESVMCRSSDDKWILAEFLKYDTSLSTEGKFVCLVPTSEGKRVEVFSQLKLTEHS